MVAATWFWYDQRGLPHSGGVSLSADRGVYKMEDSPGHSLHLEEESKADWLGFLVRYAGCVAISQAERHHHALRHPLDSSPRASPTQSCSNCVMKASRQLSWLSTLSSTRCMFLFCTQSTWRSSSYSSANLSIHVMAVK
jgi:hypothetical protein